MRPEGKAAGLLRGGACFLYGFLLGRLRLPAGLAPMGPGFAAACGFRYEDDGLLNDHELLWRHMAAGNAALCNLRVGHIVALLAAREKDGRRELLAMDSVAESASEKVRDRVREVVPGTEIRYPVRNRAGDVVGFAESYALFWVDADLPMDFTLLHRIEPQK